MEFETSLMASNITSNSSPLEVLSNAAALLEKSKTYDELQTKLSNTIKELPTKGNKMKRTKDRRELAHSSSFKIKARSGSPPYDDPVVMERGEHSLSPNFSPTATAVYTRSTELSETVSTNNTNNALSGYTTYTGFSQRAGADRDGLLSSYRGSPYRPISGTKSSTNIRRNSDPNSRQSTTQSSCDDSDDDKPLDMSNKKYRNLDCSESQSSSSDSKSEPMVLSKSPPNSSLTNLFGQQMRPSVITCAPSLMKLQQTPSHPPPSYDQSVSPTSKCNKNGDNSTDYSLDTNGGEYNKRHRNRQVVTTEGVSDPVIDEHFRRSLGKDYSQIFSNSTNNNSITYSVDDHFAKALGETWIRLQNTTNRLDESSKPINAQSIAS